MQTKNKYARSEWERRFLLESFPVGAEIHRSRKIVDRYIAGTTLRLRRQIDDEGSTLSKLTQKIPTGRNGAFRGMITTMYLTDQEFDVFSALPATVLTKARYTVAPIGIDVFDGPLRGLVLAEVEFNSDAEASAFTPPSFMVHEVSSDHRFDGGYLATASGCDVGSWIAEYGLLLKMTEDQQRILQFGC